MRSPPSSRGRVRRVHRCSARVGPPGSPAFGVSRRRAASRRRSTRSVAGHASGSAEGAHRDVLGGPRADAGQREQPGAGLGAVGARVERQPPSATGGGERPQRAHPAAGQPERRPRSASAQRARRSGTRAASRAVACASASGVAVALRRAGRQGAGAGDRDLLAEHRAHGQLEAVDGARHAQPGSAATSGASAGSAPSTASTASGSASRSSSRRTAARPPCRGRPGPGCAAARSTWRASHAAPASTTAGPCRVPTTPAQPCARRTVLDARDRARAPGSRAARRRRTARGARSRSTRPPTRRRRCTGRASRRGAARTGGQPNSLAHHVVELPDAGEARRRTRRRSASARSGRRAAGRSARAGSGPAPAARRRPRRRATGAGGAR